MQLLNPDLGAEKNYSGMSANESFSHKDQKSLCESDKDFASSIKLLQKEVMNSTERYKSEMRSRNTTIKHSTMRRIV